MTDQRCQSGPGRCRGTTLAPDGTKHAALTAEILCEPCFDSIRYALSDIPETWVSLHLAIGDQTRRATARVAGSRNPPINVNTEVDALKTSLVEWLTIAAARICDTLNIDDEPQPRNNTDTEHARIVDACCRIIGPHVDTLIELDEQDAHIWLPAGECEYPGERLYITGDGTPHQGTRIVALSGLKIAQNLAQLRHRARTLLAVTTPKDRMPYPCPGCNQRELSRRQDKQPGRREVDQIDCGSCGLSWPYSRYQQLCLILAKEDEMEREKLERLLDAERHKRAVVEWLLAESNWRFRLALDCTDITAAEFASTVLATTR